MLKHERLLEVLDYCVESGVFVWKKSRGNRANGQKAGTAQSNGYWTIIVDRTPHLAHRLAWFYVHAAWPPEDIDHINGIRTDNRIENLRAVSRSQNMQNQRGPRSNNITGFLGVRRNHKRFSAFIKAVKNAPAKYLGTYDTPEDAHAAYMTAKAALHIQHVAADRGVVIEREAVPA